MKLSPSYREFYQKSMIPMGVNDQNTYQTAGEENDSRMLLTHWLVALQGEPENPDSDFYVWRVIVYPANSEGSFKWNDPYYASPPHRCIQKAIEFARTIETCAKSDNLINSFSQKIS